MLDYALEHREAVDAVTQWRDLGLRKYELEDNEWVILQQLHDILKVRACACSFPTPHMLMLHCLRLLDSKGCNTLLLTCNA